MLSRYHIEITKRSLGTFFSSPFLREVALANVRQDTLASMLGVEARQHVCNCEIAESLEYVAEEHALIVELAGKQGNEVKQRAALGRLLHTVQDFYAHTNYVALWVATRGWDVQDRQTALTGVSADVLAAEIAAEARLDPAILRNPTLKTAQWSTWREPLYYLPALGPLLRRYWLPDMSHEAIHLDSPERGVYFQIAAAIARQHTRAEYARAVASIRAAWGIEAVARFHGASHVVPEVWCGWRLKLISTLHDSPSSSSAVGTVHQREAAMELYIRGVSKTYPNGVRALDDVSLTIPRSMYGLLGLSSLASTRTTSSMLSNWRMTITSRE